MLYILYAGPITSSIILFYGRVLRSRLHPTAMFIFYYLWNSVTLSLYLYMSNYLLLCVWFVHATIFANAFEL